MDDPFKNIIFFIPFDDSLSDFFPKKGSEEVRKVFERYIKKPKIYRLSTKSD